MLVENLTINDKRLNIFQPFVIGNACIRYKPISSALGP
jgi:hypothetical protein